MAGAAVRRAHDCLERHRLSCRGRRPRQPETLSAWRVAGPYAGGDRALDADTRLPFEEGDASGLGLFSGAFGLHHGRLQRAGPVAWLTALRVGFRAPLDSGI